MKKILLGALLLLAWTGCPDPKERPRPQAPGDPNLDDPTESECRFCGARGTGCCPNTCREVHGQPLNTDFCLYNLRCLPVSDGGGRACVD